VAGAGQTPGTTIGNGRAIALLLAREGAQVLCVDRDLARAEETAAEISREGHVGAAFAADIRESPAGPAIVEEIRRRFGGFDILVNNVGIGSAAVAGDGPAHVAEEAAFDEILATNLKGMWMTIKAAIPALRAGGGSIVNVSSIAAIAGSSKVAYELSKAGVNRLTLSVAAANAKYRVRCNAVLPGMMDTPMAMTGLSRMRGKEEAIIRAERDAQVPLAGGMGTGWDTAYATLFLASDEARFVTGALLPVDGGLSTRIG
jgi:NAD(P)-dependent dehydrogenase (short-subunit alcohol dehydrogenase family)